MKAKQNGDYEKALDIWLRSRNEVPMPDTKIGTAYIRLATEQQMKSHYELASLMYRWGLSADKVSYNREALQKELEHLKPLLAADRYDHMQRLIDNDDARIYERLKSFWKELDPTPTSVYNERLIEHFERVNYAYEHYSYGRKGEKKLDGRAQLFLKYGPPARKHTGIFQLNTGLAVTLIDQQFQNVTIGSDPKYDNLKLEADALKRNLESMLRDYHQSPHYEVWIYNDLDENEPVIYLTGSSTGNRYELKESISDFIPSAAFRTTGRNRAMLPSVSNIDKEQLDSPDDLGQYASVGSRLTNISPGLLLQYLYYNELAALDYYFGNAADKIFSAFTRSGDQISSDLSSRVKEDQRYILDQKQRKAPSHKSKYIEAMARIDLDLHPYRFLDENSRPYLSLFVDSDPYQAFLNDYLHNKENPHYDEDFSDIEIVHYLQIHDLSGELITETDFNPPVEIDVENNSAEAESMFHLPYPSQDARITVTAELHNNDSKTDNLYKDTPFPHHLRGLGSSSLSYPPPLNRNTLELSDMVLGFDKREDSDKMFPFVVSHQKQIPTSSNMVFHLEVYNLGASASSPYLFQLDYQIFKKEKGLKKIFGGNNEPVKLTLNLQSEQSRSVQTIEVQTQNFETGTYQLLVEITDLSSGNSVSRTVECEIVDPTVQEKQQ